MATENFLASFFVPAQDEAKIAPALSDQELVNALEEILIPYVIPGVARDLQRLAPSGALLVDDANGHPPLATVLPTGQPSPDAALPGYRAAQVDNKAAYDRYFDWYIAPDDVGGGKSGVAAFFERYPLTAYAVKTVGSHYRDNIQLACERIAADWADIGKAFFPGRTLVKLLGIETTGNDFHKGGKQVLILTFELDGGDRAKVVYKPSAVEIDCRIVGDSSIFPGVSPKGPDDAQGYAQAKSLTEILNRYNPSHWSLEGFTTRKLPTYKILPYNRGSVPDAYGYIEFLSHDPATNVKLPANAVHQLPAAVGAEIQKLTSLDVMTSDWIVTDPVEARVFCHQFGAVMAMTMAVSQCDLHVQNMIVHDTQPCLIDLEEALKWPAKDVSLTYIAGQPSSILGHYHDPENPELVLKDDLTSDLTVLQWKAPGVKPASCVLYVSHGAAAPGEAALIDGDDDETQLRRRAMISGFVETIEALATQACNNDVKAWVAALDQTIARYVMRATKEYADARRTLYTEYFDGTLRPGAPDAAFDVFSRATPGGKSYFFRNAVTYARSNWVGRWTSRGQQDAWEWPPAPAFLGEHPSHAWRDYLNCDVPSFYHVLGTADLLNSKGDTVDVSTVYGWQQRNITGLTDPAAALPAGWDSAVHEYLPEPPIDMVDAQLERLRVACTPPGRRNLQRGDPKQEFLKRSLGGSGLDADFQRIGAAARQVQPGPHA